MTTGEWAGVLREVFGEYRPPTGVAAASGGGHEGALTPVQERVRALGAELGRPLKFLVGKPGLDGHSNGAEQIAFRARDCGMDITYEGIRLTPEQIVARAAEEDAHIVGLSILSGSHLPLIEDLMERGAIPPDAVELLELAVLNRLNIMISGGTGSGKTTVLRCTIRMVPKDERLVIAEDTAENLAPDHPHKRSFEAPRRKPGGAGVRITMQDLIVNMLRQRPDRPIVGEIRTPEACAALVDAINTGHGGMISTIHSNGGDDTFDRLALLYARQAQNIGFETIQALIKKNIDLVVHVSRDPERVGDEVKVTRRLKEIVWVHEGRTRHLLRHTRRRGYEHDEAAINEYKDLLALT